AVEILSRHMLRMLNTEAPVRLHRTAVFARYLLVSRMRFSNLGIQIKNDRDGLIPNGVGAKLQSGGVGLHHAIAHQRERLHLVGKQSAVTRLIAERFEKIRSAGP